MENETQISLFDNFEVRRIFYEDQRYFVINDIVYVLTESKNVVDYIKKLRARDFILSKGWGQIITPLWVNTRGGRQKLNCCNTKGALRLLQSIPSIKAEPFKQWLSTLGEERLDEVNNPELGIERAKYRAIEIRRKQGHDEIWISKRLQSINTRNSFTDILKDRGIKDSFEYALLTNKIYSLGLGVSGGAKQYRQIKGIRKTDNLRDHMDNLEIALVDLAEAGSHKIIQETGSEGFNDVQDAVISGSEIVANARESIEKKIGKSVVSAKNYLKKPGKNLK